MSQQPTSDLLSSASQAVEPIDPPEAEEAVGVIVDKLQGWIDTGVELLPNFAVAVVTILVFWLIARITRKVLHTALERTPLPIPLRNLIVTMTGLAIVAAGLFVALGVLGLDRTVMSLLAGVGILGLALGFAFQDIAANFIAGILLSVRRPIHVGDVIETNDFFGTVREINLRSTIVESPTGQTIIIPNKQVFENPLTNYSTTRKRRIDLAVGVSYGDDLSEAKRLAVEAVEGIGIHDPDRQIELFFEEFGSSSINFVIRFWIDFRRQTQYLAARSEAVVAIKQAFEAHGITIPFPIRTLDFGIVGGEKLTDHLHSLAVKQPVATAGSGE
jgi:small conductance mechanosensitive channel